MIMIEYFFSVGGFLFGVYVPEGTDVHRMLPSFRPFRCEDTKGKEPLFRFYVHFDELRDSSGSECIFIDESLNDMGRVRLYSSGGGYHIKISFRDDEMEHYAVSDSCFKRTDAYINKCDRYAGEVVSSLLRMVYSQAVIPYGGISVHASAVILDGKAYLFMGKSGTGKSTHSALWMKAFSGCELMNDDNPVITLDGEKVTASGTPWSGKTPCYRNISAPVGGIVRLKQAGFNKFLPLNAAGLFINLLPGCSVIRKSVSLQDEMHNTLARVSEHVRGGMMECLPDVEAAAVCRYGIENKI